MGYSWAFSLKVTVPEDRLDALRKADVGAVKPPAGWGRANDTQRGSVASVMAALAAEEMVEVTWTERGVSAVGVLSNDSSAWADLRTQIAGVVPAARDVGGSGELAVTGWTDGGPSDAFVIADGALAHLTGDAAKDVEARVHAEVEPVVEEKLEALSDAREALEPPTPPSLSLPADVAPFHAEIVAALRKAPNEAFAAAARRTDTWPRPKGVFQLAPIATIFPTSEELLGALEHGWKNLHRPHDIPALALELLAEVDRDAAESIAKRALAADVLHSAAHCAVTRLDSAEGVRAALEGLRSATMRWVQFHPVDPLFMKLRDVPKELAAPVVRELLARDTEPPLDDHAALFAFLLTHLLFAMGDEDDRARVLSLWIEPPHPRLANFYGADLRGGEVAKALFAETFGVRGPDIDYGHNRQAAAVRALVEREPSRLLAKALELAQEPSPTREQTHGLQSFFEAAEDPKILWSSAWADGVRAIATRLGEAPNGQLAQIALAARGETDGVDWAIEKMRGNAENVERLAQVFEKSGNAGVVPRLQGLLPELDTRSKKRVEKCIAKLGGTSIAAPQGHHIGVSPSARAACRVCKEKIPKGELRFGEAGPNQFSSSGEMSHRWYHLRCAAEKKAKIFGPVLDAFTGEVPDREALAAAVASKTTKPTKPKKNTT